MSDDQPQSGVPPQRSSWVEAISARTPARILAGRAGTSYRTGTQLALRLDHAAALDAIHAELEMERDLGGPFVERWRLFEVSTRAASKGDYLLHPEQGRRLADESISRIVENVAAGAEVQVVIGDGLSAAAVVAQVPGLLPLLERETLRRGWRFGRPFLIRHCRVGVLNDIGECLRPEVGILLIGERPGLAAADSLSAYLTFRPRAADTDARRNVVSNIHVRGVAIEEAATRILNLADTMIARQSSGVDVKEDLTSIARARLPLPGYRDAVREDDLGL